MNQSVINIVGNRRRSDKNHVPLAADEENEFPDKPLLKQGHFVKGVVAQFCYVAAQTGIFSYLINFVTGESQYPRVLRPEALRPNCVMQLQLAVPVLAILDMISKPAKLPDWEVATFKIEFKK